MITREAWLNEATKHLRAGLFKRHGAEFQDLRCSVGFPGGRGPKLNAIGQIWYGAATNDGMPQVFISPVLDEATRVLDVLVHELVHAATPGAGHKGAFKTLALKVGLTGKMTATVAGPALKAELTALAEKLGPYPHAAINLKNAPGKPQTTRLIKVECRDCGYPVRVTRKWIEDAGAPVCPCGAGQMTEVA